MDIILPKNGVFNISIPKGWNSMIYLYEGNISYKCGNKILEVKNL